MLGSEEVYIPDDFKDQFITLSPPSDGAVARGGLVHGQASALPFGSCSVDLVILPHVLEFEEHPHEVLREVERVLKPEGLLFVLSFNPFSVRGLIQYWPRRSSFWHFNFIPHHRILDWMYLLKFDARYHAAFSVATAEVIVAPQRLLQCTRASLSIAYAVKAIKRTFTVIPIERTWLPAPGLLAGQIAETSLAHDAGAGS